MFTFYKYIKRVSIIITLLFITISVNAILTDIKPSELGLRPRGVGLSFDTDSRFVYRENKRIKGKLYGYVILIAESSLTEQPVSVVTISLLQFHYQGSKKQRVGIRYTLYKATALVEAEEDEEDRVFSIELVLRLYDNESDYYLDSLYGYNQK